MLIKLLMIATVCFWGWSFVATKICLEYMTPIEVIGLRYLLGVPILGAVIASKRMSLRVGRADLRPILLGAAVITIHFTIQITGMKYTTATNTGWIISVTPLVMMILSIVFLKEKITGRILVGIAIATTGILLLVSHGDIFDLGWLSSKGDWMVFASAHTWAVYTALTRNVSRRRRPLVVSFLVLAFSAVVLVTLLLFTTDWGRLLSLPLEPILAMLFLGIVCLGLAFWFWQEGVSRLGAARAGIFLYLEPLATTALAIPYLGEHFGIYTGVGGLMVLGGVYLAERRGRKWTAVQQVSATPTSPDNTA